MDGPGYQRHSNVQKHTYRACDCAEIDSAAGLMLLAEWKSVAGASALMSMIDYSGKLERKAWPFFRKAG